MSGAERANGRACDEPGRSLFFEHVGSYFLDAIKPKPTEAPCGICGCSSPDVPRYTSSMDGGRAGACAAQIAIVSKRPASGEDPMKPVSYAAGGNTAFGDGCYVIASKDRSLVFTNVALARPAPPSLEVRKTGNGASSVFASLLASGQFKAPFVAARFAKKAMSRLIVSISAESVELNDTGGEPESIDVPRVRDVARRLAECGFTEKDVPQLLTLRHQGVTGVLRDEGRELLMQLRAEGRLPGDLLMTLPDPQAAERRLLVDLLSTR